MKLLIIPVINTILMNWFAPSPSLKKFWLRIAYDTVSVLAYKNVE